ncbi:MAG: NADH-quinone oxidoreductase subunit J [Verrucomicrobiae bacterium]|nr:NADH-quinone oxidoreductase subunit J [Verrucomicrobiae bacterium]
MNAVFLTLSAITVLGALLAVTLRNLVHCLLALVLFFFGVAGHFFLMRADFLGAVQILIYVGAVAVLILFAIMLTRNVTGAEGGRGPLGGTWWLGAGIAAALAGLFCALARRSALAGSWPYGATEEGVVRDIGRLLVTDWVVPLEVAGVLLTAALIGAVVVALEEGGRR